MPAELRTDEMLLRMLRASDVELDYEAVIASREILLIRSSGQWPRDGFTLAENLADLQRHEQDHLARTSFTFTVMNPMETLCLGCVYINPLAATLERLGAGTDDVGDVAAHEAVVTFWVRPEYRERDLDRRLLEALRGWFAQAWAFSRVTFMANQNQLRELGVFEEAGLRRLYSVDMPREPYACYIYG